MIYTGSMKCIIGLGNPESRYAQTRHNVGFMVCDHLASEWGVPFKRTDKFHADIAEMTVAGEKVLIIKPTTYYNEVGQSTRAIADFYKLTPADFLIIHDDFALPLGTIRTRIGGSGGGNNGIRSLSAHLGEQTARIRIGIYQELRDKIDDADFVLGRFTATELKQITAQFDAIEQLVESFLGDTFSETTHHL